MNIHATSTSVHLNMTRNASLTSMLELKFAFELKQIRTGISSHRFLKLLNTQESGPRKAARNS